MAKLGCKPDPRADDPAQEPPVPPILSAADRNNPGKLSGDALRHLAWQKGLAKSSLPGMSDEKIREQLRYIVQNEYAA